MAYFGGRSKAALATCHVDMRRVSEDIIKWYDHSIIWGHRDEETQNEMYNRVPRVTKARWPDSKHNELPSLAIDFAPWPLLYEAPEEDFCVIAGAYMFRGYELGIEVGWGGDWNLNRTTSDEDTLKDWGHLWLVNP